MALNLNAIGKGYALDRMASVLRRHGVGHALLSAGSSSILALGGRHGGWPIDIRSPLVSRPRLARVRLRDGAVGTSGAGEQFVIADGTRFGHVIDPRTGWPAQGMLERERRHSRCRDRRRAVDGIPRSVAWSSARSYCGEHPGTLALLTVGDGTEPPQVYGKYPGATVELGPGLYRMPTASSRCVRMRRAQRDFHETSENLDICKSEI